MRLSRLDALRIAVQSEEENQRLTAEVDEMRPKAQALDLISTSDGSMAITNAAKLLQMRPVDLFTWLDENKWTYRRTQRGPRSAYQNRLEAGVLEYKIVPLDQGYGNQKTAMQVRITPKGLTKLAAILEKASAVQSGDARVL